MNYKDLPLKQRMELASQYALLLVADDKPTWEIIGMLKSDYALSEEQAAQAVGNMRATYKNEYNSTVRNNFLKALGALGFSLVTFLFYYFIGKEMGRAGNFFIIIGALFGLGGVGALLGLGRIIGDKFSKPAAAKKRVAKQLSEFDKFLQALAMISGFLLCFAAYEYFFEARIIDTTQIVAVDNCVITRAVTYEHTGGKNRSYYYVLKLHGSNLDFRFRDSYYKYSSGDWEVSELKEFDKVSIQILRKDMDLIKNEYNTGHIDIINLGRNGRFLVDHAFRNTQLRTSHKKNFYVTLYIFAAFGAIILLKMGLKPIRRRNER